MFLQQSMMLLNRQQTSRCLRHLIRHRNTSEVIVTASRNFSEVSSDLPSKEVREVQIPVPWGHVSGKWWGPTDAQPLLGLHGWQDNAGTFDRLAPLLPPDVALLAVDFPGHGLSSHLHPGVSYQFAENAVLVRRIMKHYGWGHVDLLGHSLGSIVSFVFSCIYPDLVRNYIGIDAMKPYSLQPLASTRKAGKLIDLQLKVLGLDHAKAPSYSREEAGERLVQGTKESISRDVVKYLLVRGLREAGAGKFQYTRDARLKVEQIMTWTQEMYVEMASHVRCNVLMIDGDPGLVYDKPEKHQAVYDVVGKSAKSFRYCKVEGTHHLHLTTPERVAPIINDFLAIHHGQNS